MTRREWRELQAAFGDRCAYCGVAAKLVPDHVVPSSRGGEDSRDNLAPACRSCNSSKGDLLLLEWIASTHGPCKRMALHRRNPLGLPSWNRQSSYRYIELRPEYDAMATKPEHISSILPRVLAVILRRVPRPSRRPRPSA